MKDPVFFPKLSTIFRAVGFAVYGALVAVAAALTLLAILVFLYIVYQNYAEADTQRHMERLNREVSALADTLGYTPGALLFRKTATTGYSGPFLNPGGFCATKLYFATPLTLDQFTERVTAVSPVQVTRTQVYEGSRFGWEDEVPVTVLPAGSAEVQALWRKTAKTSYLWHGGEQSDVSITLYDVMSVPVKVAHHGRPLEGNIVEIFAQIEVSSQAGCPYETVTP